MKYDQQFRRILLMVASVVAVASFVILLFFKTKIFTSALGRFMYILEPFIYGFAIAYLLNPVSSIFEKYLRKLSLKLRGKPGGGGIRMTAILLAMAVLAGVITLLLIAVLPSLVESISSLITRIPGAVEDFEAWLSTLDHSEASHEAVGYIQQITVTLTEKLQNYLQTSILPNLEAYVSGITSSFMSLFNVLKNFGLGCIVASYLLGGKERFCAQARLILYALVPEKAARWIEGEVHFTDSMFSGFIHGKLLDSLIIGILCYIFTLIAGMPYALLISVIVGVTNIIPFFGPYLGAIPSILLILTVDPVKALVFLVFIILLQQFDGNILGPSILGDRLGISGIWILFSILLFSSLWGIVGMLIGVPVFAVLYDMIRKGIYFLLRGKDEGDMIAGYESRFPREADTDKKKKKSKS